MNLEKGTYYHKPRRKFVNTMEESVFISLFIYGQDSTSFFLDRIMYSSDVCPSDNIQLGAYYLR